MSAVVPTLDEAALLPKTIGSLREAAPDAEVIVVDGGSADGTAEIARGWPGVRLATAPRGRAAQMNAGAAAARGEILWFVHADTRAGPDAVSEMRERLRDPAVCGGALRFAVDSPRHRYRWLERGVRLRCRLLRLPYGDQALFVRRRAFECVGGFPDWPILEDVGLVRRLWRLGRLALLDAKAWTSPRRYEENGFLATVLRNAGAMALYAAGQSPEAISRLDGRGRGARAER